jgi:4-hydroxybenzoate polyprenyltransferase
MGNTRLKDYSSSLRPGQWVKNLFIFLPLVFGKKLFVYPENLEVLAAFCLFSLVSSTAYIFNDLIDLGHDKLHSLKRHRPIASGRVSAREAVMLASFLGGAALLLSFRLNSCFGCLVLVYFALNIIYSKILKKLVIIDVFCIAVFFLLRILAGSIISGAIPSCWIIFMTGLLALFLGFSKRRQELNLHEQNPASTRSVLDKYNTYFIDQMISVVTSSVVITYMLYAVNSRTVKAFGSEHLIYGVPFVYYGIFRYLYIIHKQNKGSDPTGIVLSDLPLQLNLLLWLSVCIGVIYFGF